MTCATVRRLARGIRQPNLPEGFFIRNVTGEADLERRVAVHRDAFAPSKMTVEKHRRVMHAPTYRPEIDLMVEAPDGSFAVYCLVWFDAANRIGIFEPVGCHSTHRRRGLTKAVMFGGMRRLHALGAETAFVDCVLGACRPLPSTSRSACRSSIAIGRGRRSWLDAGFLDGSARSSDAGTTGMVSR